MTLREKFSDSSIKNLTSDSAPPKHLHRELKLHCVKSDVSVMEFVVKALEEKLQREAGGKSERRRARA